VLDVAKKSHSTWVMQRLKSAAIGRGLDKSATRFERTANNPVCISLLCDIFITVISIIKNGNWESCKQKISGINVLDSMSFISVSLFIAGIQAACCVRVPIHCYLCNWNAAECGATVVSETGSCHCVLLHLLLPQLVSITFSMSIFLI